MSEPKPIDFERPSPETLAGIYVYVEGEEDLTVYPRQIPPVQITSPEERTHPETTPRLYGGPVDSKPEG